LLTGNFQFRVLALAGPRARLTRSEDGKLDLPFLGAFGRARASASNTNVGAGNAPFNLAVEAISITGGSLTLRDAVSGAVFDAGNMNFDVTTSARGQIDASGTFALEEKPASIEVTYTPVSGSDADGLNFSVRLAESDLTGSFVGAIGKSADRTFRGDLSVSAGSGRAVLAALGIADTQAALPPALQKPFSLTARVRGDVDSLATDSLMVDLGDAGASGAFAWTGGSVPHFDVELEFSTVDLESWMSSATQLPAHKPGHQFADVFGLMSSAYAAEQSPVPSRIPRGIAADVDLRIPLISHGDEILRDGHLSASLQRGQLE
ncbi:MAG: hypothetical protein RLN70_08205, partial [Rhodospirillaceae bacterium]